MLSPICLKEYSKENNMQKVGKKKFSYTKKGKKAAKQYAKKKGKKTRYA